MPSELESAAFIDQYDHFEEAAGGGVFVRKLVDEASVVVEGEERIMSRIFPCCAERGDHDTYEVIRPLWTQIVNCQCFFQTSRTSI